MSIGEVAAELASAASEATAAASRAVVVSHDIEETAAAVARLTHTTTAPEPPATIAAWDSAADHARRAAELLRSGNQLLAAYLKAIGAGAGSPLVEPTKSGTDLLEETKESVRGGGRLASNIGDMTKVTKATTKLVQRLVTPKPTGTSTRVPSGPTVGSSTPSGPAIDEATSAALAITMSVTAGVSWLRKRRNQRRQENESDE